MIHGGDWHHDVLVGRPGPHDEGLPRERIRGEDRLVDVAGHDDHHIDQHTGKFRAYL